eukprot:scaffold11351_cov141-Isochrysis_galbana.AAC.6
MAEPPPALYSPRTYMYVPTCNTTPNASPEPRLWGMPKPSARKYFPTSNNRPAVFSTPGGPPSLSPLPIRPKWVQKIPPQPRTRPQGAALPRCICHLKSSTQAENAAKSNHQGR